MKSPFNKKNAVSIESPSSYEETKIRSLHTDRVDVATKEGRTQIASYVWTLISVVYTFVTVIVFVVNNWVPSEFNAALLGLLVAWVVALIVIVAVSASTHNADKGRKALALYKKFLKIFKGIVNIMFLAITAVSMTGIAVQGFDGLLKLLMFIFTFVVAVVQVALKVSIMVIKAVYKSRGKKLNVEVMTFVDGKQKENKIRTAALKRLYGQKKNDK